MHHLTHIRHAELVSASMLRSAMMVRAEGWTLKRVQGDRLSLEVVMAKLQSLPKGGT